MLTHDHDAASLDGVRHGSVHGRGDTVDHLFQGDAHALLHLRHDAVTLLRQVARVDHDQVDQRDTCPLERREHALVTHIGGHADDHRFRQHRLDADLLVQITVGAVLAEWGHVLHTLTREHFGHSIAGDDGLAQGNEVLDTFPVPLGGGAMGEEQHDPLGRRANYTQFLLH